MALEPESGNLHRSREAYGPEGSQSPVRQSEIGWCSLRPTPHVLR